MGEPFQHVGGYDTLGDLERARRFAAVALEGGSQLIDATGTSNPHLLLANSYYKKGKKVAKVVSKLAKDFYKPKKAVARRRAYAMPYKRRYPRRPRGKKRYARKSRKRYRTTKRKYSRYQRRNKAPTRRRFTRPRRFYARHRDYGQLPRHTPRIYELSRPTKHSKVSFHSMLITNTSPTQLDTNAIFIALYPGSASGRYFYHRSDTTTGTWPYRTHTNGASAISTSGTGINQYQDRTDPSNRIVPNNWNGARQVFLIGYKVKVRFLRQLHLQLEQNLAGYSPRLTVIRPKNHPDFNSTNTDARKFCDAWQSATTARFANIRNFTFVQKPYYPFKPRFEKSRNTTDFTQSDIAPMKTWTKYFPVNHLFRTTDGEVADADSDWTRGSTCFKPYMIAIDLPTDALYNIGTASITADLLPVYIEIDIFYSGDFDVE